MNAWTHTDTYTSDPSITTKQRWTHDSEDLDVEDFGLQPQVEHDELHQPARVHQAVVGRNGGVVGMDVRN